MSIEEKILNDNSCSPYVDKGRGYVEIAFKDGAYWGYEKGRKDMIEKACEYAEARYDLDYCGNVRDVLNYLKSEETKFGTASNPIEPKSNANCLTLERVDALATKIDKELPSGNQYVWELPDDYQFVDENGNVINTTKIVLEKKNEYPKTYEECCEIMNVIMETEIVADAYSERLDDYELNLDTKIENLRKLIICRDAYWKIAGDWKPEFRFGKKKYCIMTKDNKVISATVEETNRILTFPTEEMRDVFYESFKELIEICKELL